MNVVNVGSSYRIYGEDLKTYNYLPVMSYEVCFNKMTGFYLNSRPDLITNETKIYGTHQRRVDKVLKAFNSINRNFGVILSGEKGIGKSLWVRLLAMSAVKQNLPVILVNEFVPGIAQFLMSIEQSAVIIFDEFEKTFGGNDNDEDDNNMTPQDTMLSLFDGIDNGKKLFVITCNDVNRLNKCLLNRPGRFHYHFTLKCPTPEEIEEYMNDKLEEQYRHWIPKIIGLGSLMSLTYDCLRAIAFELNMGEDLNEALKILNISGSRNTYCLIEIELEDGSVFHDNVWITLWENNIIHDSCYGISINGKYQKIYYTFHTSDIYTGQNSMTISPDNINVTMKNDNDDVIDIKVASVKLIRENVDDEMYRYTV